MTIHASAVLVGARAVLIRGAAGAGKSSLAFALISAGEARPFRFARLVGDDRVHVEVAHGRLLVRPHATLAGLIEVRGLGIRRLPFEPVAAVGLVVDLGGVTFLDSSGVEALFRLQASLEVRQQRVAVAIPAGATIRRALELSGAPGEMPLCGSVDEALAVLRAGPERGAQETG